MSEVYFGRPSSLSLLTTHVNMNMTVLVYNSIKIVYEEFKVDFLSNSLLYNRNGFVQHELIGALNSEKLRRFTETLKSVHSGSLAELCHVSRGV